VPTLAAAKHSAEASSRVAVLPTHDCMPPAYHPPKDVRVINTQLKQSCMAFGPPELHCNAGHAACAAAASIRPKFSQYAYLCLFQWHQSSALPQVAPHTAQGCGPESSTVGLV
jgi:hypothetical protein